MNENEHPYNSIIDEVLADHTALIANVVDERRQTRDGKETTVRYYRPIEEIGNSLRASAGNWPRVAGGMLFVTQRRPGGEGQIRYFNKSPALFAWMQERMDLRWSSEPCVSPEAQTPRTPATKEEFFNHLKDASPLKYSGTSPLPHVPEIPGVYYLPPPPIAGNPHERQLTGRLEEFVTSLNPETEMDRDLLRALIVTLAWGGTAGSRPAFVLASEHGRGVGKSATAEAICEIWGGAITVNPKDDPDAVRSRLLDDAGLAQRAVFMDNLKGRMSNSVFESILTRKTIDGKRMYHGQFSRPNFLTWVLTSNTPKLSEDMAVRCVIIMMGKQKHAKAWVASADSFVRQHKWEIIHDCMVVLKGQPISTISPENRDRYQAWQDAVLCRCSADANAVARLLADRRGEANADHEDAEEVANALNDHARSQGVNLTNSVCRIDRVKMHKLLVDKEIVGHDMTKRGVHTWLTELRGSPSLLGLRDVREKAVRVWVWNPNNIQDDGPIPL